VNFYFVPKCGNVYGLVGGLSVGVMLLLGQTITKILVLGLFHTCVRDSDYETNQKNCWHEVSQLAKRKKFIYAEILANVLLLASS
jgi:hypothetical protein